MRYPKPGATGGVLIRRVIAVLRGSQLGVETPLATGARIWLAISGGPDSMALALLLVKYGRRVCAPSQLGLIHVNHGWRGEDSQRDERRVLAFGKKWGLRTEVVAGQGLHREAGRSWEEAAREERKQAFEQFLAPSDWLLTAHTADDQAETVLWRIATGSFDRLGAGIRLRDRQLIRPLLSTRKTELREFLREERQGFGVDRTNKDTRFLRARLRRRVMPELENLFPRIVENLVDLGMKHPSRIRR